MDNSVQITLRGIPASDTLERYIGSEAGKLGHLCDRIRECRVIAEALQRERQGAQFAVRLIITLPGTELVVNREHRDDVRMALREAFAAAALQLEDHMRRHGLESGPRRGARRTP
jgi:ribosome-associated translation inhibitor RaiA